MAFLLLYFALHPEETIFVRELHRQTELAMASLQNELKRLERLGLLGRQPLGNKVTYRIDFASPRWSAFRALIRQLAEPTEVLRAAFAGAKGVDAAFVFGSQARGDMRPDSDVDLFVLGGEEVKTALRDPLAEAESLMGRDIDLIAYTRERAIERARADSPFLRRILHEPKEWVAGDTRALAELEAVERDALSGVSVEEQ